MEYQITSDNMEVTPSMEALATEKFARIEHRAKDIPEGSKSARIVLNTAPTEMFTVKAHVNIDGHTYFSDETDYTLESAVIRTVDELLNMMDKEKDHSVRAADPISVTEEMMKE